MKKILILLLVVGLGYFVYANYFNENIQEFENSSYGYKFSYDANKYTVLIKDNDLSKIQITTNPGDVPSGAMTICEKNKNPDCDGLKKYFEIMAPIQKSRNVNIGGIELNILEGEGKEGITSVFAEIDHDKNTFIVVSSFVGDKFWNKFVETFSFN
ncbi:hypothetical protein HON58_01515 [Candidatus Peregrinibacteria bacterium]|jgi:hypothetical protein|nr:hypothetical protein [Candidatus Peregrinibacteria bacterium]